LNNEEPIKEKEKRSESETYFNDEELDMIAGSTLFRVYNF
jgi:hypothetical protein